MKIICAWCRRDMGEKDGQGVEGVSHSICGDCQQAQLALLDAAKARGEIQAKEVDNGIHATG